MANMAVNFYTGLNIKFLSPNLITALISECDLIYLYKEIDCLKINE